MSLEKSFLQQLQHLRHELHQHPEIAGEEKKTANRIKKFVLQFDPDTIVTDIGGHGMAVIFEGIDPGPAVMIRSELDGLPIHEENDLKYRSVNDGKGHKCGHDGHMVMVAALAKLLSDNKPRTGKVILLFQPAEETGEGAARILKDKKFRDLEPDYIFALHNLPGYPKNQIVVKKDTFASASKGLIIALKGKTSHAAEPERGKSPAFALSELIPFLEHLDKRTEDLEDFSLATVVHARLGDRAFGTTPGKGVVMTTIRAYSDEDLKKLESAACKFAGSTAKKYGLQLELSDTEIFSSTLNNEDCVNFIRSAAKIVGADIKNIKKPFRWSEDFGLFTQQYKGAIFGLGSGEKTPDLHNPDYDFPDAIIPTGVSIFYNIINELLNKKDE